MTMAPEEKRKFIAKQKSRDLFDEFLEIGEYDFESKYGSIYRASAELGLSYSTLWRWKNGKQKHNTATLERIGKDMIRNEKG